MIRRTRIKLKRSNFRHDQEIAQIGMPRAVEVGMAETHYGFIIILVTSAITIYLRIIFPIHVVGDGIGIGA